MIQKNQQKIQYFQNQAKMQQLSPYILMGLWQQVHLVIMNQESIVGLMSRISLIVSVILQYRLLIHVNGIEQYPIETILKDDYESLTHGISWKEINYHVHNRLFDHRRKLYILQMDGICHRFKMCHGQHHQAHHLQVIDRMYWHIFWTRSRVRELYPRFISIQSNFYGPKAFKWRGLTQEDLIKSVTQFSVIVDIQSSVFQFQQCFLWF